MILYSNLGGLEIVLRGIRKFFDYFILLEKVSIFMSKPSELPRLDKKFCNVRAIIGLTFLNFSSNVPYVTEIVALTICQVSQTMVLIECLRAILRPFHQTI